MWFKNAYRKGNTNSSSTNNSTRKLAGYTPWINFMESEISLLQKRLKVFGEAFSLLIRIYTTSPMNNCSGNLRGFS